MQSRIYGIVEVFLQIRSRGPGSVDIPRSVHQTLYPVALKVQKAIVGPKTVVIFSMTRVLSRIMYNINFSLQVGRVYSICDGASSLGVICGRVPFVGKACRRRIL